ncbi:Conserved DNA-binding protein YbaB [Nonomuraea solani]|uniref:Conserved DNA-binding protein YbaB n=1 Tax=Nonomuraea solani TaxID=1144553 RepID=A0A1H6EK64_9ACTN|nr:YbaB/EbfC family nucleoid-associated protein [Nonomuraea solani]SEG98237.1 Conserved DNA-binding protein YbaB [Nonomuraea solani]
MHGQRFDPADITEQGIDEVARQGERVLAWLETAQADLDQIVGAGEAAAGQVKATVDVNGRVLDVTYGSRALRVDSRELAAQTLAAVAAACADAQRQTHDLMREAMPGFDPVAATQEFQRLLTDWS